MLRYGEHAGKSPIYESELSNNVLVVLDKVLDRVVVHVWNGFLRGARLRFEYFATLSSDVLVGRIFEVSTVSDANSVSSHEHGIKGRILARK